MKIPDVNAKWYLCALLFVILLVVCCLNLTQSTHDNGDGIEPLSDNKEYEEWKKLVDEKYNTLSIKDFSSFYSQKRAAAPFLDNFYRDSIVPKLYECDLYELKDIYCYVKSTPVDKDVYDKFEKKKIVFLEKIKSELEEARKDHEKRLEDTIKVTKLRMAANVNADMQKLVEKCCGGIFEYKKYLLWNMAKRVSSSWNDLVKPKKYEDLENIYVKNILDNWGQETEDFMSISVEDVQLSKLCIDSLNMPKITISQKDEVISHIKKYSEDELITEAKYFGRDMLATVGLSFVPGANVAKIAQISYDLGSFGYDMIKCWMDIDSGKPSGDQVLVCICTSTVMKDINKQVDSLHQNLLKLLQNRYNEMLEKTEESLNVE